MNTKKSRFNGFFSIHIIKKGEGPFFRMDVMKKICQKEKVFPLIAIVYPLSVKSMWG